MDSNSVKNEIVNQVRQQYAMENVRLLMEKVNVQCFERCVPKPGSSLASSEQTCFTQCMEKYILAWNQTSTNYITRLQQRQQQQQQQLMQ
ncbi:Tim10/DDP family zinc finger-domain-containing protein [Xylariomycetidae sp. FL0641]|nr:Tim10/DDP family zinc finger-domain-containing protein [Xylariomycetidae sp. FL0641]